MSSSNNLPRGASTDSLEFSPKLPFSLSEIQTKIFSEDTFSDYHKDSFCDYFKKSSRNSLRNFPGITTMASLKKSLLVRRYQENQTCFIDSKLLYSIVNHPYTCPKFHVLKPPKQSLNRCNFPFRHTCHHPLGPSGVH